MSLNYNFLDTFKLLLNQFRYIFFLAIILSTLIFIFIIVINKKRKVSLYLLTIINIILIILILYYYLNPILSFKYTNPINNIYFYFFNSIIYLILSILLFIKNKYKIYDYIIYYISIVFIFYSLFMTHYLNNSNLLVIGNIFPMIKFGNILYIIYYLYMLLRKILKGLLLSYNTYVTDLK